MLVIRVSMLRWPLNVGGPVSPCRNALSPDKLVDTFPAPDDHVKTLYDNLENTISKLPDVSRCRVCKAIWMSTGFHSSCC